MKNRPFRNDFYLKLIIIKFFKGRIYGHTTFPFKT